MRALILAGLLFGLGGCDTAFAFEGYATYYTVKSCQAEGTSGTFTASGERFIEEDMTCALPKERGGRRWGREWHVNGPNGAVVARYNDQGPGRGPQAKGVVIDLSPAAFKEVCGELKQGRCWVNVMEVL